MSQPPWPYGPPPAHPPRRGTRPWLVAGACLLAVATVVTLVLVLTAGPDRTSARGVAEAVVDAVNDGDYQDLTELSCTGVAGRMADTVDLLDGARAGVGFAGGADRFEATATLVKLTNRSDDRATAHIGLTITGVPAAMADEVEEGDTEILNLTLALEHDEWCVRRFGG